MRRAIYFVSVILILTACNLPRNNAPREDVSSGGNPRVLAVTEADATNSNVGISPISTSITKQTSREAAKPPINLATAFAQFTSTPTDQVVVGITATSAPTGQVIMGMTATSAPFTPTFTAMPITVTPAFTDTPLPTALPTEQSSSPTPSPTPTLAVVTCAPIGNENFEQELIDLINAERKKLGYNTLLIQPQLVQAARGHSKDMSCNGFFSHTSEITGSPFERITSLGYTFSVAGENIAAGYTTALGTYEGWINSPGHKENMFNPDFIEVGLGYTEWADSEYLTYVTAVFARP